MKQIVITMEPKEEHIPRELILEQDDFEYLINKIMHCRHVACQKEAEAVEGLHIFETAKTIATAASILNMIPDLGFYKPYMIIDRIHHEAYLTMGIRYTDDYHSSRDDCVLTFSYKAREDWQGYRVELTQDNKVVSYAEYPLFSEIADISRLNPDKYSIYGYDMNFPMPSEFRRRVRKAFQTESSKRWIEEHKFELDTL